MNKLGKRTLLLVVAAASFAMALSGIFNGVNAQSNISCCLTEKGKLKNCELGENPRKECRKNQTLITLPFADTLTAVASPKTFFVTKEQFDGDLVDAAKSDKYHCIVNDGIDAADCICQLLADNSDKVPGGTYKAWLSDSTRSPSTRLTHPDAPYVNVNGEIIADNYSDLIDGNLKIPPIIDEYGNNACPPGKCIVWTGTNPTGHGTGDATYCTLLEGGPNSDWKVGTDNSANGGIVGDPSRADDRWTLDYYYKASCNEIAGLYCLEQ